MAIVLWRTARGVRITTLSCPVAALAAASELFRIRGERVKNRQ